MGSIYWKPGWFIILAILFQACAHPPILDEKKLAQEYFETDTAWYLHNIPFFECSDKQIEQVYYYRWKLYKAHIRKVGKDQYVITEFINHVSWDRDPYCTINAASMHHICEGRWIKDQRYLDGYIHYLYHDGGNNRKYSESIADAAYNRYLVNSDSNFVLQELDSMKRIYEEWADHYDSSRNLYFIPAMPDATEYTIASIDASGGKDGFDDGEAYRPTINSYMYANAKAIANIAAIKGDSATQRKYSEKAVELQNRVRQYLWNDSLQHFADRFKVNNQYVHSWDFIRGRELAGFIPWYFNLPPDSPKFNVAWKHVLDTNQLLGQYGFRTNEPSYQYYFKQFVIYQGQRGSQWNGPSWPYQSSQVLTAMANLLNNYKQEIVHNADYVKMLRLFARQHFLPNGKINLVENYDPNVGGPIVYYYWSNHYNHSSFNNLIITGLCGIRPNASDTIVIHPLVDSSIKYFCLQNLLYHGHLVTVLYDQDGSRYNFGKGLTVFVDGRKSELSEKNGVSEARIGSSKSEKKFEGPENYALNIRRQSFPIPSASTNNQPDSLFQAIDGRVWYFPEITNRWTSFGSGSGNDWYALDFGQPRRFSKVAIYLYSDGNSFKIPDKISIDYREGNSWRHAMVKKEEPGSLVGNTVNNFNFDPIEGNAIRINFQHSQGDVALVELEVY